MARDDRNDAPGQAYYHEGRRDEPREAHARDFTRFLRGEPFPHGEELTKLMKFCDGKIPTISERRPRSSTIGAAPFEELFYPVGDFQSPFSNA